MSSNAHQDPEPELELTDVQKAYNVAQNEMFQLAAHGHHRYAPLVDRMGKYLTIQQIEAGQRDYNQRLRTAREELEAATLRLVAEHAETMRSDWGPVAAWLRSLADDPAELSLLAVHPDERQEDSTILGTTADKAAEAGLTPAECRAQSHQNAVAAVRAALPGMYASVACRIQAALADEPQAPEDPARIDRIRPEFTDHASIESIDAQIRRTDRQCQRWDARLRMLTRLRRTREAQIEAGVWPPTINQEAGR